jgi:hypothetical protein
MKKDDFLVRLVSPLAAGVLGAIASAPFDRLRTANMVNEKEFAVNDLWSFIKIVRKMGILWFYTGVAANCLRRATFCTLFYNIYYTARINLS